MLRAKSKASMLSANGEGVGDQRRHVDLAGGQHRDRARVDVGVAEDVLDPRLLDLRRDHVVADRLARHADIDHAPAGADQVEHLGRGPLVAGALEHDVGTPAVGLGHHRVGELAAADVDAGRRRRASRRVPSLGSCTSLMSTRLQPPARAASAQTMPIGPAPITTARSPGAICGLGRGMHADRQRLDHRARGIGDVVRQPEGEVGRMHHGRPQHAVHRRRRPEAHLRIEIVLAQARRRGWSDRGCPAPCRPGRRP